MQRIFHSSTFSSRSPRTERLVHAIVGCCLLLLGTSDAASQSHDWSYGFGDTKFDYGMSTCVDGSGNVIVSGYFQGTVNFGGGALTSAGYEDIFLAKYDVGGNHLWSQRFGGPSTDQSWSVSVDSSGNVFVTGSFIGTAEFGGGGLTSAGAWDIFLAKYDASGAHLWSRRFGGTSDDRSRSVSVDDSGNVFVTGYFYGTSEFGGGPLTSAGYTDIFLAKYDASGAHLWSQRFGGTSYDRGHSAGVSGSGNVFVTGVFAGTVDFGGGPLTGADDVHMIFLAKYDASGTHLWSQEFGGYSSSLSVDGSENVFVTGYFSDTVDLGGGPLTSAGGFDVFLAKYDAGGAHLWSQRFGGPGDNDESSCVSADGSGNVFVTGLFMGTADFGGGGLISAGGWDIFVAKYDAGGAHLWSRGFGDISSDSGKGVGADGSGNVFVTGYFNGTVDFGGGPLTSAGDKDAFVAKFGDADVAVVIGSFGVREFERGIALYSSFTSRFRVLGVNIYRAVDTGRLLLYEKVLHSGNEFYYADTNIEPGRTYHYRIGVVDQDGQFFSQIATVKAGGYDTVLPPNVPNPFNPETTIRFTLEKAVHVTLAIYDVNGKRVTTLIDDIREVGPHEARWDGTDATGSPVSSGVYFCLMRAGKTKLSRRMVLLK